MNPSLFLANLHHAYAQTDGTYAFPNSREGDMLKQAKREIDSWLDKTPRMADGTPILLGDEIWFAQDGYDDYPWTRATKEKVSMISFGQGFMSYRGGFTVCADSWEGGNLDCYRTAEEVPGVDR